MMKELKRIRTIVTIDMMLDSEMESELLARIKSDSASEFLSQEIVSSHISVSEMGLDQFTEKCTVATLLYESKAGDIYEHS